MSFPCDGCPGWNDPILCGDCLEADDDDLIYMDGDEDEFGWLSDEESDEYYAELDAHLDDYYEDLTVVQDGDYVDFETTGLDTPW